MGTFTIELVSNTSAQLFPDSTQSPSTRFLRRQLNLEEQWEVVILEISYPLLYRNVTEGELKFFDEKLPKSSEYWYLEPSVYPSFTDTVEAMNTLIQERHNHSESCITV